MKQIIRLYTLLVVSCLLSAGCNSDEDMGDWGEPVAVQFGMGGITQLKTTAGGDQWALNDPIGIFMIENGQALSGGNIAEGADNIEYKAQADGDDISGFTSASGTPVFYPHNGDNVDFIAYYPYKASLTGYTYPVDVSNQETPANIDVLYANTNPDQSGSGYNKHSGTVDLLFNHALSKLSFTLISGDGSPVLAGAKVEITNLATTADINLVNGTATATNSGQTITAKTAANGLSSLAIMIPQTLSGAKLIVTLADNESKFEWDFPSNTEFLTGKNHQYTITVSKTGIKVSSSGITIWTGSGEAPTSGTAETLTQYEVGDPYPDAATAIGIVFWLDPDAWGYNSSGTPTGYFGKIVSPESLFGMSWGPNNIATGATSETDGLINMAVITSITNWETDYPVFAWIDSKNTIGTTYSPGLTGIWYLPSKDELEILINSGLLSWYHYWSSTENALNTTQAWIRQTIPSLSDKNEQYKALAILKF